MQKFANLWVLSTLLLFYFGPVPWEGAQGPGVAIVVIAAMVGLNLGCMTVPHPSRCTYKTVIPIQFVTGRTVAYIVVITFLVLTASQIHFTTGKSFFYPSDWSLDFGAVYAEYQESTELALSSSTFQNLVWLTKTALFPVALVVFCHYFIKDGILTFLFLFTMIGSSFMRGTDKEIFDVVLIIIVVAFYKGYTKTLTIGLLVLVPVFLFVFVTRKLERNTGLPECIGEFVCMNYDSALAMLSPKLEFGVAIATIYLTNGYQGLSVALNLPFEFHFGLGHLPTVERTVCGVTGLFCDISTYDQRITAAGWPAGLRWTSMYPTLANDLTFFFIPTYMALMGRIMRSAEIFWRNERNPMALATLVMFAIFFAYSSANMQVAISLDWAFAWIVLVYVPLLTLKVRDNVAVKDTPGGEVVERGFELTTNAKGQPTGVAG